MTSQIRCGIKRQFDLRRDAEDAADRAGLRPYICNQCGWFHLSSMDEPVPTPHRLEEILYARFPNPTRLGDLAVGSSHRDLWMDLLMKGREAGRIEGAKGRWALTFDRFLEMKARRLQSRHGVV